jgi:hypothetical protein
MLEYAIKCNCRSRKGEDASFRFRTNNTRRSVEFSQEERNYSPGRNIVCEDILRLKFWFSVLIVIIT